jgi:hypothetical protein
MQTESTAHWLTVLAPPLQSSHPNIPFISCDEGLEGFK